MLKHYVPLHLGGMSDPFQKREWKYGITKRFLEISNKYNYPINISTRTSYLPDEYWNLLNPEIHTFQISLIGVSDEYIRKFETNTPLASERIKFVKELKRRGFWVSIRIQPIIDINEVLELIIITFVSISSAPRLMLVIGNVKKASAPAWVIVTDCSSTPAPVIVIVPVLSLTVEFASRDKVRVLLPIQEAGLTVNQSTFELADHDVLVAMSTALVSISSGSRVMAVTDISNSASTAA